jgi:enamine deaminase RidA (YjgF/YER057c/UK114 family)
VAVNRPIEPATLAPPAANYAHAVLTEGATAWLHTSGVVPIAPDGSTPPDVGEQATIVWANIAELLAAAEMELDDVVAVTTYVVVRADATDLAADLAKVMKVRDAALVNHRASSTLVTVPALARPEWKVEISIVAAR